MLRLLVSPDLLRWAPRPRVSDRFQIARLLVREPVVEVARELLFLVHGCRVLGSSVGDSRPFPVRLCSSLVKDDVDESALEPAMCHRCQKDAP